MNLSDIQNQLPPVPPQQKAATYARLLQGISGFTQVGLMVALFVLWKQFQWPFWKAFEWCFVAGLLVYVTLGTIISIMMSVARMQPLQMLLRRVMGIVSLLIFGALHYVYKMDIIPSAGTWVAIYAGSRLLLTKIETAAMQRFQAR